MVESRGVLRREIDSEAETASRGGNAAEKTKAGELIRYRFRIKLKLSFLPSDEVSENEKRVRT